MILLALSDFDNYFSLAQATASDPVLEAYIARYEKEYIVKLLGVTFGEAWITDMAGTPSAANTFIKNEFYRQDDNNTIWHSRGMKDYLCAAIFYHYIFDTDSLHSQSGVTHAQAETSYVVSYDNQARFAERKFNDVCVTCPTSAKKTTAESIQWYCKENETDYPDYNGTEIKVKFSALL